ncbi:hypothetical protein HMPREF7215_1178 [Pyramidobacter piscolens W5455]|uniref:Uncharacterized protein n=1 Tax=Pyramidobacter piscolens W5455 TaxID=352165 RepID=A0ABM9ZTL4_9BACT|nr:hypothetical protein HMPREF7215_1178 [Pyramidobacter piscolens W5455]
MKRSSLLQRGFRTDYNGWRRFMTARPVFMYYNKGSSKPRSLSEGEQEV